MFQYKVSKNKNLLSTVALSAFLVTGYSSAQAEEVYYDIYGNAHLSVNTQDNTELTSNTSSFGIKGGRKLGDDSLEVIFQMEWQVNVSSREKNIVDRDQWIGFKGNFGKVLIGTSTSNYKSKGGKVDPMYRTRLEARSAFSGTQSRTLHAGAGIDRGRLEKSINYTTPKFNGFELVMNTTISGSDDESSGLGIRHSTKKSLFYVDIFSDGDVDGSSESAVKVGGFYKFGKFKLSGQVEQSEDIDGSDYWMLGGTYKLTDKGTLKLSTGGADGARESSTTAIMYDQNLGGNTNIYIGFGSRSDDIASNDDILTIGARYKF
jgi:hypothetical protein